MQNELESDLKRYFNYSYFHEGQKEIITDILEGKDVLGILKTGSGKSLCYQLPAKILPGLTIVVSPLISLMIDQVRQAKAFHFKDVVALHSFQSRKERQLILHQLHHYKLVYVSPELLQQQEILQTIKKTHVSLFVVDEAHCISQWGYDFRPDYLRLTTAIEQLGDPPILALTGTATPQVQQDIIKKLNRKKMQEHIYPMDRHNISLLVHEVDGSEEDKINMLQSLLESYEVPTIIYFSSRKTSEYIANKLSTYIHNRNIAFYHGGMDTMDRLKIQQQFMSGQLDLICCTSAFGMGINKKDIRFVIHYHLPTQLESYIQEIGRAGRDGDDSVSLLLYRNADKFIPQQIIENELPVKEEVEYVMNKLYLLHINNREIPTAEKMIEQFFQVNPTKWRFLHYQFESHGMIKNNKIHYNHLLWKEILQNITEFCLDRLTMKRIKLNEMIDWSKSEGCLREHLYKSFQQSYKVKNEQCCSNCGFSFDLWKIDKIITKDNKIKNDWEDRLASLLLIGVEK